MTGSVTNIASDAEFMPALEAAGDKLVVVDCFATWCGPCRRIAPVFAQLAPKFPNAVFLKVDVDECGRTATSYDVTAMPTFLFFRKKNKIDVMLGADPSSLEDKIRKLYDEVENEDEDVNEDVGLKDYIDLLKHVNKSRTECLNESDEHTLQHAIHQCDEDYLESDCDEQLIISIEFTQPVKLFALKINGPYETGPKNLKLFINQPHTVGFDEAESKPGQQELTVEPEHLKEGGMTELKFVKFQSVSNIVIFIKDNMTGAEKTRIDYLGFVGVLARSANMKQFKRVAGKTGESHY
ncbi:hypothetical protein NP493_255g04004 [Ridgeia piscesae]|uniref:Thioredoxin n=1 Tax=Ridgeia piscesae TaxID=27915 RepID=A0AAD9NYB7_RIDPI|nr:hypothetical protein NP493_255g04004 [Ridgeia piscesae]